MSTTRRAPSSLAVALLTACSIRRAAAPDAAAQGSIARSDSRAALPAPPPPTGPEAERVRAALRTRSPEAEITRRAAEYDFLPDAGTAVRCFVARAVLGPGGITGPVLACAHDREVLVGAEGFARYLALRGFDPGAPFLPGDRLMTLADRFEGVTGRRYLDVGARAEGGALIIDGLVVINEAGTPPARRWFIARVTREGTRTLSWRDPPPEQSR